MKRLNEIAKSTGLSQEQKSSEASQLLKNNPNVSRLLLKLRTEKNISNNKNAETGMRMPGQFSKSGPWRSLWRTWRTNKFAWRTLWDEHASEVGLASH